MADDTIRTKWELDASQYLESLHKIGAQLGLVQTSTQDTAAATKQMAAGVGTANKQLDGIAKTSASLEKNNRGLIRTWSDISAAARDITGTVVALYRAFDSVMERGSNYSDMLDALPFSIDAAKDATHGLIGTTALMEAANRSGAMQLGLTSEQFAELSRQSTILAQRLGKDTDQAFTQLIESLGKGNVRGLETIGIVIDQEKAFNDYAKALGKTSEDLSELERQQATLGIAVEQLNKQVGDQAIDVEKAGDSWTALKNAASDAVDAIARKIADSKIGRGALRVVTEGLRSAAGENLIEDAIRKMEEQERGRKRAIEDAAIADAVKLAQKIQDAREAGPEAPSRAELEKQAAEQQKRIADAARGAREKADRERLEKFNENIATSVYAAENMLGDIRLDSFQRSIVEQLAKIPMQAREQAIQFLRDFRPESVEGVMAGLFAKDDIEAEKARKKVLEDAAQQREQMVKQWQEETEAFNRSAKSIADTLHGLSNSSHWGRGFSNKFTTEGGALDENLLRSMGLGGNDETNAMVEEQINRRIEHIQSIVSKNEGLDFFSQMFPADRAVETLEWIADLDGGLQGIVAGPLSSFGMAAEAGFGAFADGLQQALSGQKSFADAMKQGLGAFLTVFSKQMTLKGLEQAAEAIAAFARLDFAGGAMHTAAAGAFFVAAAASGIGGAALSASSSQRQARQAPRGGTERGLGGAQSAPTGQRQQSFSVTYNINSVIPPDQHQVDAWFQGALRRANAAA